MNNISDAYNVYIGTSLDNKINVTEDINKYLYINEKIDCLTNLDTIINSYNNYSFDNNKLKLYVFGINNILFKSIKIIDNKLKEHLTKNNIINNPFSNIVLPIMNCVKTLPYLKKNNIPSDVLLGKELSSEYKYIYNDINIPKNKLYILSHNGGGGLSQYVCDLIKIINNDQTFDDYEIYTNETILDLPVRGRGLSPTGRDHLFRGTKFPEIRNTEVSKIRIELCDEIIKSIYDLSPYDNNTVHINILPLFLEISYDDIENFVKYLITSNIKIIITIHDYFWLFPKTPSIIEKEFENNESQINNIVQVLFDRADLVIFPTNFLVNKYKSKGINFDNTTYVVEDHPDVNYKASITYFPQIDFSIKLLYLGEVLEHKGFNLVTNILDELKINLPESLQKSKIELYVLGKSDKPLSKHNFKIINMGKYNNYDVIDTIKNINPCLIFASSIVAETWSYSLSISLKTGIPLFYNDIEGAYRERINKLNRNNVASFNSLTDSNLEITKKLANFIEYIDNNSQYNDIDNIYKHNNDGYNIISTPFYDNYLYKNYPIKKIVSVIPLKIYQTWHTKELPEKMKQCVNNLKIHNPEFEFFLYDDNDCRNFIKDHYPIEFLNAYDKLIPGAYRADLWRLCILYKYGGIYVDIKYQCINNFKFIQLTDKEYIVSDGFHAEDSTYSIYNGIIIVKQNNEFILKSMIRLLYNVSINYYGVSCYDVSGPSMFRYIYNEYEKKYQFELFHYGPVDNERIIYKNKIILNHYDEYRIEQKKNELNKHYSILWENRQIYNNDIVVNIPLNNPIRTFCVYFPQFHTFKENDYNFYKGFTDINNIDLLIKNNKLDNDYLTPNLKELELTKITDYNLLNDSIVQKQIDILTKYNLEGLVIYYYWFSINTITNKHHIMENVINKFFSRSINMNNRKVYFMWANEDWSKNVAFSTENNQVHIQNKYDEETFNNIIEDLIPYFKHDNYLKINNKPVFFIHHPLYIPTSQIILFKIMLNEKCILHSFDGIIFYINNFNTNDAVLQLSNIDKKYNINNYHSFPNYNEHSIINGITTYNYTCFVNDYKFNNSINTIMFDFDNQARMYKPDRSKHRWKYINVNESNHTKILNKFINNYLYNQFDLEFSNVIHMNAWNEWGENMAIEPSNEKGYYYLELIKRCFFQNIYLKQFKL